MFFSARSLFSSLVMFFSQTGAALRASKVLDVPLINAGDGVGEHPTQALLDLYTMHGEFVGRGLDGLTVTMVGDLKNGRTVHSLAKLLAHFKVTIHLVSPDSLRMPDSVQSLLTDKQVAFEQHSTLDDVMKETDVLYGEAPKQRERYAHNARAQRLSFCSSPACLCVCLSFLFACVPRVQ